MTLLIKLLAVCVAMVACNALFYLYFSTLVLKNKASYLPMISVLAGGLCISAYLGYAGLDGSFVNRIVVAACSSAAVTVLAFFISLAIILNFRGG